jgi:hypothetical protein
VAATTAFVTLSRGRLIEVSAGSTKNNSECKERLWKLCALWWELQLSTSGNEAKFVTLHVID